MIRPSNIIWIKHVTNKATGRAYLDLESLTTFLLHFPNKHKGNVLSPKVDDYIALYQTTMGKRAFTHLVKPIDDIRVFDKRSSHHDFARKVELVAMVPEKDHLDIKYSELSSLDFRGISQGNACKISNIKSVTDLKPIQESLHRLFSPHLIEKTSSDSGIENSDLQIDNDDDIQVIEGKLTLKRHISRERNQKIITLKKQQAISQNNLKCEVCSFSFIDTFGAEFIECHHIHPISDSFERVTTLDDLALVCANCHRMLHHKIDGNYKSIHELKLLL